MSERYLVWDLGATKCAAAVVVYESARFSVESSTSLLLSSVSSLADMADALHQQLQFDMNAISGICIAAAGCYDGTELRFAMRFAEVAQSQNWADFSVVHDYTPVAACTFVDHLDSNTVTMLRSSGQRNQLARRVALGVGTGLGLKDALALSSGELWFGDNEAGHIGVTLPPECDSQQRALFTDFMRFLALEQSTGSVPITFETVLSGTGFAAIYRFFSQSNTALTPKIAQLEMESCGTYRQQTLSLLGWFLGLFVGTLELLFMPKGGIWIGGGVIKKNLSLFSPELVNHFWSGLECMPAYATQRGAFPLGVFTSDCSIYVGGALYAHCINRKKNRCMELV